VTLVRHDDGAAAIRIDGRLDEAAWDVSRLNEPLRMIRPDTLEEPPWGTDFRVFYTEKGLYLSVDMEQPPGTLVRRLTARDVLSVNRDYISISIDTSGSGRYGYWMNLALGDNQIDGTLRPERQFSQEWDGAWFGATSETPRGWTAELFIPWSQMAMTRATAMRRIGIYMSRRVAHLNQVWAWPALPSSGPVFMSAFQPLTLSEVDPRQQWSVFPFVALSLDGVADETRQQVGIDGFWRLSTNLQLTATVNPDFGAVEADDVIVNLTADEAFFPERRLFFQEGQEIFATTPRADPDASEPLMIINTRRIGGRPRLPPLAPGDSIPLSDRLRPVDLIAAARATGETGPIRYGLLTAFEDETPFDVVSGRVVQPGRDFIAGRVLYEDERHAAYRGLGLIATRVAHPDGDATAAGVDFHLLTTGGTWKVDGQLVRSDLDIAGKGTGAFADLVYTPRQGLAHSLGLTWLDDRLELNDFGFQTRNDVREVRYALEWVESGFDAIRDLTVAPSMRYRENAAGFTTDVRVGASTDITLNNLDRVLLSATWLPPQYDDRNSFGNGTFAVEPRLDASAEYRTDTAERLSLTGAVGVRGEATGGRTLETKAGLTWRPTNNVNVEASVRHLRRDGWLLHQEGREFTTFEATQWQPALVIEFFPDARQQFRLALQWAGVRAVEQDFLRLVPGDTALVPVDKPPGPADDFGLSQLNMQLRYRWQIAPLSDLFVVYTRADTRRTELAPFADLFQRSFDDPLNDLLVVKLRYRFGT